MSDHSSDTSQEQTVNPLMIPLLGAIETALNQLIAMDPDTLEQTSRFEGKVIAITLSGLDMTFYFLPGEKNIAVMGYYSDQPDTHIIGHPLAFARLMMNPDDRGDVFNGGIKIEGDIPLGQKFQRLFAQLDIDWEEHLSHITGDLVAHQLGRFGRNLMSWGREASHKLQLDAAEYVEYESRDIVPPQEMEPFIREVDELRSGVERAEARINRLAQLLDKTKK